MANVNIPVTIQIRNAEFQKLASDQIRKQLSKDIASAVSSTGNLTKEFKDATASADAFTGRIATIARLINRGFTFKDRNVKAYFDTLTEGGKAAVSRLVTLQSAINKLQTGKISANAFNKILNAQVLPDPLDNSDRAKAFRSLVNSTVTAAALDYERLTKTVERETKKQTELEIRQAEKRKRIVEAEVQRAKKEFSKAFDARESQLKTRSGDAANIDASRLQKQDQSTFNKLKNDITERLIADTNAERKAAEDYVKNSNFVEQQVEKAKAELRKAFDAREQTRQDQAGKAAQTESKILQEADKTRAANLKDDIKNRYAILNKEEQAAFARQLDAVRNVALTSGNEARSIFQEAKRQAASLVRSGIISQEDFDVINRRFSEIAAKVQEINRIKAKDSDQGTIAAIGADGNALAREVQNGRDLVNTLNQAKTAAEQRAAAQKEQEASAKRLATLEERNNEIYRQRISVIEKQQALARETIAIANANGRLANNPSEELRRLERFASADPRSLVAVAPPGGGPPRPPVAGGGPEDFFSDDDAARRTVSRLRSVVAQQAKFNGIVQRFGELTGLAAKRYGAFLLGTFAITRLTSAFAAANQEALQFEKLIGRLSQTIRVFNDTLDQARSRGLAVGDAILEAARRTGVASNEIAQGVVEIAQAGNEQLGALQFVADQLANTQLSASFDDIKSTAEGLIAVQGQFNLQLSDTGNLLDKINQVSVEYAVESGNFFEAVKRGGATFAGLGGTFEEFIEYLTLIRSATRETAPTLGVFFKTGLGRLSKSAQQQIFQEFGVDAPGQGRSVIDQLRELANNNEFQSLSDTERIRTTIALFGAQQAGRGEALLRELGKESSRDRSVQDVIAESTGSVGRDIKIVEEDVNRSIGRITQSFQSLFNVLLQDKTVRAFFKAFADGLANFTDFVNNNKDLLNFFVRLTAAVTALAVALNGLKFAAGIRQGITGQAQAASDILSGVVTGRSRTVQNASRFSGVGSLSSVRNSRLVRGIGIGAGVAAVAGTSFLLNQNITDASSRSDRILAGGGSGIASGAGLGALVGSVVPVLGTAVGAVVGGIIGGLKGAIDENSAVTRENSQAIGSRLRQFSLANPEQRTSFGNTFSNQARQFANAENSGFFNALGSVFTGMVGQQDLLRVSDSEARVSLLRSNTDVRDSVFQSIDQLIKSTNFSEQELNSPELFRARILKDTNRLGAELNPLNDPSVTVAFSNLVETYIDGIFNQDKERSRRKLESEIEKRNKEAAEVFDFSDVAGVIESNKKTLSQLSTNLGFISEGFEKFKNSLENIVVDITSVRDISLNTSDTGFRQSIGLQLGETGQLRDQFVQDANFLLGKNAEGFADQLSFLFETLSNLEPPTTGPAAELEIVQSVDNLINNVLQGVDGTVRDAAVNVLGTLKTSLGSLPAAIETLVGQNFNPEELGDSIFQIKDVTDKLREIFKDFGDSVSSLNQKILERSNKLQELFGERAVINRQILTDNISRQETDILRTENRDVSSRLGNFFNTERAFNFNPSRINGSVTTATLTSNLGIANDQLIRSQGRFDELRQSNASPQALAEQQSIVTQNLIAYNTALQNVNERQSDLGLLLDLASKAVSSFREALDKTRSGLRSLGQVVLQTDPTELRNQGNLLEGFRRFITNSPNGLDQGIRNSVGRLGSPEQAQELIKALENFGNLPIAKDAAGILTGQDAINIILEEIALRSFGSASGRGRAGRNEIEELLRQQQENVKSAQAREKELQDEQRALRQALLDANKAAADALGNNSKALDRNKEALDKLTSLLEKQVQSVSNNLSNPSQATNLLNANLKVEVEDIKVSFNTDNLQQFGQNAVADALNRVGQVLTDLYIDEPEKLAKVKLLNVQADRIT